MENLVTGVALVGIVLILVGMGLHTLRTEVARRVEVIRVRQEWQRSNRSIKAPPVLAKWFGDDPTQARLYTSGATGALGVVDGTIIFAQRDAENVVIALKQVRWVGSHNIRFRMGTTTQTIDALIIHYEMPGTGKWRRAAVEVPAPKYMAAVIAREAGLRDEHLGRNRPDYGPVWAMIMRQDIYGQWQPASKHLGHTRYDDQPGHSPNPRLSQDNLHLVPGRLLFAYRTLMYLKQIRRLDVYYTNSV